MLSDLRGRGGVRLQVLYALMQNHTYELEFIIVAVKRPAMRILSSTAIFTEEMMRLFVWAATLLAEARMMTRLS